MGHHRKHREEADKTSTEGSSTSSGRSSSRHRRHRHPPSPPPLAPVSPPLLALPSPSPASAAPSPLHIPLLTLPALITPVLAPSLSPSPLSASPTAPGPIERALQTAGHSLDYALSTALSAHSPAFASRLGRLDAVLVRAGEEIDRTWPGTAERVGSLRRGVGRELERWEAARALWVAGGDVVPYNVAPSTADSSGTASEKEKEKSLLPLPAGKGQAGPDEDEDDAQSVMANPPLSDSSTRSPSACALGDHKPHDDEPSEASEPSEPVEPSEDPPRELCPRHRL